MALGDCLKWRYEKTWCLSCWQQKLLNIPIHRWNMWCLRKENDLQMQTALAELDQEGLELLTAGKVWPEFVGSTSSVVAHFRGSRENLNSDPGQRTFASNISEGSGVLSFGQQSGFYLLQVLHICVYNVYIYILYITQQQLHNSTTTDNWQQPFCWLHSDDVFFCQTSVATFLRLRSSSAEADLPAPCRGLAKTCCAGRLRNFSRRDWRQRRPNWENRSSGFFGCFFVSCRDFCNKKSVCKDGMPLVFNGFLARTAFLTWRRCNRQPPPGFSEKAHGKLFSKFPSTDHPLDWGSPRKSWNDGGSLPSWRCEPKHLQMLQLSDPQQYEGPPGSSRMSLKAFFRVCADWWIDGCHSWNCPKPNDFMRFMAQIKRSSEFFCNKHGYELCSAWVAGAKFW